MRLHPDLLNNSLFLRYYQRWQGDPLSVTFVPIAEYFLQFGMIEEAQKIASVGLKEHPNLITGHLVMAKIYLKMNETENALSELNIILSKSPRNMDAIGMMKKISKDMREKEDVPKDDVQDVSENEVVDSFISPMADVDSVSEAHDVSQADGANYEDDEEEVTEWEPIGDSVSRAGLVESEGQDGDDERLLLDIPEHMRTVTLAKIFTEQGHTRKAREIYRSILQRTPENVQAKKGLVMLEGLVADDNTQ